MRCKRERGVNAMNKLQAELNELSDIMDDFLEELNAARELVAQADRQHKALKDAYLDSFARLIAHFEEKIDNVKKGDA